MSAGSTVLAADQVVLISAHPSTPRLADNLVWVVLRRWGIDDALASVRLVVRHLVAESMQATARDPWSRLTVRLLLTMDDVIVQVLDGVDRPPRDQRWDCRLRDGGGRVVGEAVPLAPPAPTWPPVTTSPPGARAGFSGGQGMTHAY